MSLFDRRPAPSQPDLPGVRVVRAPRRHADDGGRLRTRREGPPAVARFLSAFVLAGLVAASPARGAAPGDRGFKPLCEEPDTFKGPAGRPGGRLVLSSLGSPKSYNVHINSETITTDILSSLVFENLLRYDNVTQKEEPGLCSRWSSSKDGKTWTFVLRKGIRWSDGVPITADDVIFTTKLIYDEKLALTVAALLMVDDKPIVFTKVDPRTIRAVLPDTYGPFLHVVSSFRILPRHRLEKAWKDGTFAQAWSIDTPPDSIVTSGAFRVASYTPNESIVLKPNPWYYRVDTKGQRLPYLDEFVWVIVPDMNADLLRFKSGDLDAFSVRAEDVKSVQAGAAAGGYTVQDLGAEFGSNFVWFNQNPGKNDKGQPFLDPIKLAWFTNRNFREALAYAIDRESIIRNVYYGQAVPLYGPIPPVNRLWYNTRIQKRDYDLDKARALLAAAGFKDRNKDGIVEDPQGNRVAFSLYTNSSNNERKASATLLAEDFRAVGLDVTFTPLEFSTLVQKATETFDYDTILLGATGANPPDPILMMNSLRSSGRQHYWNPMQKTPATPWEARIDSLMNAQISLPDDAARKVCLDEVQAIFAREVPTLYTVGTKRTLAVRNRVRNARPTVFRPWLAWNADEIYIDPGAR